MARAVHISSGALEAAFVPDRSMFGVMLRHRDDDLMARPGMPFLYPWANRLRRWSYTAANRRVRLQGLDLPRDDNDLPIHGVANVPFEVVRSSASEVRARVDSRSHELLTRAFPFPHKLTIAARVEPRQLRVTTTITPTSDTPVPVSFGFHPYFRIPGVPRRDWVLGWPTCTHVALGPDQLPTGAQQPQRATTGALGGQTYDDHYELGSARQFTLASGRRRISVAFSARYGFAQLYAPPRRALIAIEPMTATVDALGRGLAPTVEPGSRFSATFTVTVA